MLEYPGRIFFSRWEKPDEDNGWLYGIAYRLAIRAKESYFNCHNFSQNLEWWKSWNVLELHGWENPSLHIVEYENMGIHPYPKEVRRLVFAMDGSTNQYRLSEWPIKDPFLLHHSYKLIPEKIKDDPLKNPQDRKRWFDLCKDLYAKIESHSIIYHPGAHQQSTWLQLQKLKKIKIINLPDDEFPFRLSGWDVIEIDPEIGYADFGAL